MTEQKMVNILLVSRDKASMSAFKAGMRGNQVQTAWAESGGEAIIRIAQESYDLVVADEVLGDMTGLELIEAVVSKKPTVNCAVVSSLSPADFHKSSEGLGILMQLPAVPGQEQGERLLSQLKTILNLAKQGVAD